MITIDVHQRVGVHAVTTDAVPTLYLDTRLPVRLQLLYTLLASVSVYGGLCARRLRRNPCLTYCEKRKGVILIIMCKLPRCARVLLWS